MVRVINVARARQFPKISYMRTDMCVGRPVNTPACESTRPALDHERSSSFFVLSCLAAKTVLKSLPPSWQVHVRDRGGGFAPGTCASHKYCHYPVKIGRRKHKGRTGVFINDSRSELSARKGRRVRHETPGGSSTFWFKGEICGSIKNDALSSGFVWATTEEMG